MVPVRLHRIEAGPADGPPVVLLHGEERRFQDLVEALRSAANDVPGALAVWMYGSVARGDDGVGSNLDIAVLTRPGAAGESQELLAESLGLMGTAFGIAASVVGIDTDGVDRFIRCPEPWLTNLTGDAITLVGEFSLGAPGSSKR